MIANMAAGIAGSLSGSIVLIFGRTASICLSRTAPVTALIGTLSLALNLFPVAVPPAALLGELE